LAASKFKVDYTYLDRTFYFLFVNNTHLIKNCVNYFRYNPENLQLLEQYVEMQSKENTYDLEANLAILKLYQLDPAKYNLDIVCQIMLKAITNFPHTDFVLCKCLLSDKNVK
jgi:hypothetical protein